MITKLSLSRTGRRVAALGAFGWLLAIAIVLGHGWLGLSAALLITALVAALVVAAESHRTIPLPAPRKAMAWLVAFFFAAASLMLSVLIPPMQSPDEPAHLARAYTLWDDEVFLKSVSGSNATQDIDHGLQTYLVGFGGIAYRPDHRVYPHLKDVTQRIRWSDKEEKLYNPAAPYFPALYAPAAVGIGLARSLDQPPWVAVSWARMLMWGTGALALWLALIIVQAGFRFLCAVSLLPMTLAQTGSANLDATTIPLAFLLLALYSWSATSDTRSPSGDRLVAVCVEVAAWISLTLLALAKPVFLVFALWPLYRAMRERNLLQFAGVVFVVLAVAVWQVHIASSGYLQPHSEVHGIHQSPLTRLLEAALSPIDTTRLLAESIAQKHRFYWESMVGILGWLDTPLGKSTYALSGALLLASLLGDALSRNLLPVHSRSVLLLVGFGYAIGCMLLLWATWTPPGSRVVEGVSGRYFLPLLPVLGIGFGASRVTAGSVRYDWMLLGLFSLYAACLMVDLPTTLIARYWL